MVLIASCPGSEGDDDQEEDDDDVDIRTGRGFCPCEGGLCTKDFKLTD